MKGMLEIMRQSAMQALRQPIYWLGMLFLPLFMMLFLPSLMRNGIPERVPAAMVDRDGTALSRQLTQQLGAMQMVDIVRDCNSYTEARHAVQEGDVFGFFLIPENYQADLLAGRAPAVTFYTNETYFVPATLLFKTFKTTALFSKAGIAVEVLNAVGATSSDPSSLLQPVSITSRPIGNPGLNYSIYLSSSFVPAALELMILLMTCFTLGQEIKYRRSRELMRLAGGNVYKAVFAKLLPQTLVWWVLAVFMESWLFRWMGFPMHGSWWWLTLSELMFVVACQGFGLFIFAAVPNLRLSLSVCALLGILAFSLCAFSFPEQSMYGAVAIFAWVLPTRYNFLIYIDQALNGMDIYYSRLWFVAYIVFMLLPLALVWRLRKRFLNPVYHP